MPVVSGINIEYLNFLNVYSFKERHIVFINYKNNYDSIIQTHNVNLIPVNFKNPFSLIRLLYNMYYSQKIIIHSFFIYVNLVYLFFPNFITKSFLVLWGGDLYFYYNRTKNFKNKVIELLREIVLSKWINIVTYINEDFNNYKRWYNVNAIKHHCIMYPSNVFTSRIDSLKSNNFNNDKINLMVGNSAISENRHEFAFKILNENLFDNILIYCPLSYGDRSYADKISQLGISYFGFRFNPIIDYMDKDKYLLFLSKMDIVLMLQDRQAGMGNIIQLLGLGKKLYFTSNAPHFIYLRNMGFIVFDIIDFNTKKLSVNEALVNFNLTTKYFNYNTLIYQWKKIFEYENNHTD